MKRKHILALFVVIVLLGFLRTDAKAVFFSSIVKDINPGTEGSFPWDFTELNGKIYFSAYEPNRGSELWVLDGSPTGTKLAVDINPEDGSSFPEEIVVYKGKLYFQAYTPDFGIELWSSDGTPVGTQMVKNINEGNNHSHPTDLTVYNGKLYFQADDGIHGKELWVSDGTPDGTILLKDINTTLAESSTPHGFYVFDGMMYFSAYTPAEGFELWQYDEELGITTRITDKNPGIGDYSPSGFVEYNGLLFFRADDGSGYELWHTNGTELNTTMINASGTGNLNPIDLTVYNGKLFFRGDKSYYGKEIWVSDGTDEGTVLFKDLGAGDSDPYGFTIFNGKLYFRAMYESGPQNLLWVTDGTPEGTNLFTPSTSTQPNYPEGMIVFNNEMYFRGETTTHGYELFVLTTEIFEDGFETGNLSRWSDLKGKDLDATALCKLCVTKKGAIKDKFSLRVKVLDKKPHYLIEQLDSQKRYRARFYIKLRNLQLDSGNKIKIFKGLKVNRFDKRQQSAFLMLKRVDGKFWLQSAVRLNNGKYKRTRWTPIPGKPSIVEIDWKADDSSDLPNGFMSLYINDKLRREAINLDNSNFRVTYVYLGIVNRIRDSFNISGNFIIDNFDSDMDYYIGP